MYDFLLNECEGESISVVALEREIRSNKILSQMRSLNPFYTRVKNNGGFLRYPSESGKPFDAPGTNLGVVVKCGTSYIQETRLLVESILAQLLPDVLCDRFSTELRGVFVFYNLVRKAMLQVYTGYILLRNFEREDIVNDESRYYINCNPFYRLLSYTYETEYFDAYKIMKGHVDFCVLGDKSVYSEIPHAHGVAEQVIRELNQEYAAEYTKALRLYGSLKSCGERYLDWAAWAYDSYQTIHECSVKPYALSDFEYSTLGLSVSDLVHMLLDRMYCEFVQNNEGVLHSRTIREDVARRKIKLYNALEDFINCDNNKIPLKGESLGFDYLIHHGNVDMSELTAHKTIQEALEAYRALGMR